jgi:hypothetical protein
MSDLITVPRSDWQEMKKAIKAINEQVVLNDLVSREEACRILGISSRVLTNYLSAGKIAPDSINALNQQFFSRKKLLGL